VGRCCQAPGWRSGYARPRGIASVMPMVDDLRHDADRPDLPGGDPWLGIFGGRDGEQFAFLLVASPLIVNAVVLCGPASLREAAIPLLVAVQAFLVLADSRSLGRWDTTGAPLPSPWWAALPLGWLYLRGRFRSPSRPFAGAWCSASLVFLIPLVSMVSNPSCGHEGRGCRPGPTVTTASPVRHPTAGPLTGALPGPIGSHGFLGSSVHAVDGFTDPVARGFVRSHRGPAVPAFTGAR
jgi:hypothetical protein